MRDLVGDDELRVRYERLLPHLDEKQRRLLLGADAMLWGRESVKAIAEASGADVKTVRRGRSEFNGEREVAEGVRTSSQGNPKVEAAQPDLLQALLDLVESGKRGDPERVLVWTTRSLAQLSGALVRRGFTVGKDTVARLLRQEGFSLQGNRKNLDGTNHPDRDAQFGHISDTVALFLAAGHPVISVDTKKRELVGQYSRSGQRWCPEGEATQALVHDFASPEVGIAIPYGVYDIGANSGFVNVGTTADTCDFALASIRAWWEAEGRGRYRGAKRLLVCADSGGSNGYRRRAWKVGLVALARELGIDITVAHFPPGTSKWNKVEHRLFSYISINWRATPLTSYEVIIDSLEAVTTSGGLSVSATLDRTEYAKGMAYQDKEIKQLPIRGADFHPDWNYTVTAEDARALESLPQPRLSRTPVKQRKLDLEAVRTRRRDWAADVVADPGAIGMEADQFRSLAAKVATETDIIDHGETPGLPAGRGRRSQSLTLFQHLAMTLTYLNTKTTQGQLKALLHLSPPTVISYLKDMTTRLESVGYQPKPKKDQKYLASRHLATPTRPDTSENSNLNLDAS